MNRERYHEVQERVEQVLNVLGEHDVTATILETLSNKNHDSEMNMHVSIGAGVTLSCKHPGGGEGTAIIDLGSGIFGCLLYTSPSPRDATLSRMPSSA